MSKRTKNTLLVLSSVMTVTLMSGCKKSSDHEHKFVNYVSNNDATCTSDGTKTAQCESCQAINIVTDVGSKKDHQWSQWFTSENSTCIHEGVKISLCEFCNETRTDTIDIDPVNGHVFGPYNDDNNATCATDGTKTSRCRLCGATDTITAEGSKTGQHSFTNFISNNDATCTTVGTKTAKCNNCDASITITDINSTSSHSFTNYVSNNDATCTTDGTKTAKCDNCDATNTIADEGSKLGHSFTNYVSNDDATCSKNCTETAKCDRCDVTDTREIPNSVDMTNTRHSFEDAWTYDEDWHWFKSTCGHAVIRSNSPHIFTETVEKQPTCTEKGTKKYTCYCGYSYTEDIDMLPHSFTNYVYDNNASCEQDGTETAKCDNCDATNTRTAVGTKTGHSYSNVYSYDETGHWYYANCEHNTLKTGWGEHLYSSPEIIQPTEDSPGKKIYRCKKCSYFYEEIIPNDELRFKYKNTSSEYLRSPVTCTEKATYFYSDKNGVASDTLWFEDGEPLGHNKELVYKNGQFALVCTRGDFDTTNEIGEKADDELTSENIAKLLINEPTTYREKVGDMYYYSYNDGGLSVYVTTDEQFNPASTSITYFNLVSIDETHSYFERGIINYDGESFEKDYEFAELAYNNDEYLLDCIAEAGSNIAYAALDYEYDETSGKYLTSDGYTTYEVEVEDGKITSFAGCVLVPDIFSASDVAYFKQPTKTIENEDNVYSIYFGEIDPDCDANIANFILDRYGYVYDGRKSIKCDLNNNVVFYLNSDNIPVDIGAYYDDGNIEKYVFDDDTLGEETTEINDNEKIETSADYENDEGELLNVSKTEVITNLETGSVTTITYQADEETNEWVPVTKKYCEYDQYKNKTQEINWNYSVESGEFYKVSENNSSFYAKNKVATVSECVWTEDVNDYHIVSKYENRFDSNNNQTYAESYSWDDALNELKGISKFEKTFDSNSNMTSFADYTWDVETKDWVLTEKDEYTCKSNGYKTLIRELTFDMDGKVLTSLGENKDQNSKGQQTLYETLVYDEENSTWKNSTKKTWNYGAQGLSEYKEYTWDEDKDSYIINYYKSLGYMDGANTSIDEDFYIDGIKYKNEHFGFNARTGKLSAMTITYYNKKGDKTAYENYYVNDVDADGNNIIEKREEYIQGEDGISYKLTYTNVDKIPNNLVLANRTYTIPIENTRYDYVAYNDQYNSDTGEFEPFVKEERIDATNGYGSLISYVYVNGEWVYSYKLEYEKGANNKTRTVRYDWDSENQKWVWVYSK